MTFLTFFEVYLKKSEGLLCLEVSYYEPSLNLSTSRTLFVKCQTDDELKC